MSPKNFGEASLRVLYGGRYIVQEQLGRSGVLAAVTLNAGFDPIGLCLANDKPSSALLLACKVAPQHSGTPSVFHTELPHTSVHRDPGQRFVSLQIGPSVLEMLGAHIRQMDEPLPLNGAIMTI